MPIVNLMRRIPHGVCPLVVGMLLGAAYGIGVSTLWRTVTGGRGHPASNIKGSAAPKEALRPRVVCFGDSLTQYGFDAGRQGWLALLAHWWERRFDVINRGFSGYNTRWLMPLVEKLFVSGGAAPTKLVIIFLGANDCVLPGNPQHVPIDEYRDNLERMVAHVRKVHPEARVLLIAPPPIHEEKWRAHREVQARDSDRRIAVTMEYAKACVEVGKKVSVKVVDAFSAMGSGDQNLADKYLHDGVHFTSEGNVALSEAIQKEILVSFPELNPEHRGDETMQAPHWANVDPTNYRDSVLRDL